jgi:hypothetical protein
MKNMPGAMEQMEMMSGKMKGISKQMIDTFYEDAMFKVTE